MAHYSLVFVCTIITLHSSVANQNQYFGKPKTTIIETFPSDNTINSNERGDQDSSEDPLGICSNSEKYLENPSSVNHPLSPEFLSPNYLNIPNADPYLRATFHNGYYYPYSDYIHRSDSTSDAGPRRGFSNEHNEVWYPYTSPDVFAPYSNIPPLKSLPPVYARFYENPLPIEEAWIPKIRRQIRLEDDDFFKQLEYESIMKNILPTMPIPLARDTSPQSIGVPYAYASFPNEMSDCAIPFLLGCTPAITYGNLANSVPVPYVHAYRNLGSDKVHDHLDISDKGVKKE